MRVGRGSGGEARKARSGSFAGLCEVCLSPFRAFKAAKVALRSHVLRLVLYVSPASWASRAIWTRLLSSSFSSTRETCAFTVATLM